jgi:1-acyl-sn-glycerol-3-phosphate acyltransferase
MDPELSRAERFSLAVTRFLNEQPLAKRVQHRFLLDVNRRWVTRVIGRRVYAENLESLLAPPSQDRGVVICLNHRSYFDAFITMWAIYEAGARWPERIYFPVRSNFFYEHPLGVGLNVILGGGSLYPPIFRDASKADLNKDALQRMAGFLSRPGSFVGLHPEGTRGKGPDPYDLLPAQPGIGQIVLQSRPVVVPGFIGGLSNSLARDVASNYLPNVRRDNPIILVVGEPLDYSDLAAQKPRAALYKRTADRILDAIKECGEREKVLRAECASGAIGSDAPGWVMNHMLRPRGP